jgi:inhibitor of KinA sporulation pathway (predicted exonuclease)
MRKKIPTRILSLPEKILIDGHNQLFFQTDAGILSKKEIQELTGMNANTFSSRADEPGGYLSPRFLRPVREKKQTHRKRYRERGRKKVDTYNDYNDVPEDFIRFMEEKEQRKEQIMRRVADIDRQYHEALIGAYRSGGVGARIW